MRLPFLGRGGGESGDPIRYQIVEVIGSSAELGEAVEHAAERIAARRRSARRPLPGVDLLGLALFGVAAGGAYTAVRALLDRDSSELGLPAPLQDAASGAAGELRQARAAMAAGIVEGRRARAEAERELRADYLARSGRGEQPSAEHS